MNKKSMPSNENLRAEILQERIDAIFDEMTPAQQKATIYIRKKWEQICTMTAKEVGQKADVSEATIQRIAVCLGFSSFRDMKTKIKNSMLKNRAITNFKLKEENESEKSSWIDTHVSTEVNNIVQTMRMNTESRIEYGAQMLVGAKRIWVIGGKMGTGASGYLCFSINYLIGKTVRLNLSDSYEYISCMDDGDVLMVIGFQRYCRQTLKITELAKLRGTKILVMTDCDLSPFAKLADCALYAQTDSMIFLDSYSSVLSLSQALIARIIKLDPQTVKQNIESNEDIYNTF
ncbi:MAG: MurR/RpiR family transcriptional regulator [Anaerocolumna sp.]